MDELGIDLSGRTPRQLEPQADAEWADVVVTMGCGDVCPVLPGKSYVDWNLEDPAVEAARARARDPRRDRAACRRARARARSSVARPTANGLCLNGRVEAQIEELGGDTVRLTVDVPAHDVHHAVEHATSDLASSVKIPGFRAGKVPAPVLVQRIGKDRIYAEAVDSHISGWFWNAAARARIRPIAQPQYEYELPTEENQPWRFTATVPVQPKVDVVDWTDARGRPARTRRFRRSSSSRSSRRCATRSPSSCRPKGRPAREGDTLVVDIAVAERRDAARHGRRARRGHARRRGRARRFAERPPARRRASRTSSPTSRRRPSRSR